MKKKRIPAKNKPKTKRKLKHRFVLAAKYAKAVVGYNYGPGVILNAFLDGFSCNQILNDEDEVLLRLYHPLSSEMLKIVCRMNYAFMTTDANGNTVEIPAKLQEIRQQYGEESVEYQLAAAFVKQYEEWGENAYLSVETHSVNQYKGAGENENS